MPDKTTLEIDAHVQARRCVRAQHPKGPMSVVPWIEPGASGEHRVSSLVAYQSWPNILVNTMNRRF